MTTALLKRGDTAFDRICQRIGSGIFFPGQAAMRREVGVASGAATSLPTTNLLGQWAADAGVFKDAGVTAAVNTDTVQQWNEQSGGGAGNMAQATSGSRPQFLTSQQNGLPAVKFSGAKNMIATTSTGSSRTVFLVIRRDSFLTGKLVWGDGTTASGGTGSEFLIDGSTTSMTFQVNASNNTVTGPASATWAIVCCAGGQANGFFRLNANSSTSIGGSAVANHWVGFFLGNTSNIAITLGEVLLYDTILSTINETAVRNYLNARWAIF